jgi:hypothetical protein
LGDTLCLTTTFRKCCFVNTCPIPHIDTTLAEPALLLSNLGRCSVNALMKELQMRDRAERRATGNSRLLLQTNRCVVAKTDFKMGSRFGFLCMLSKYTLEQTVKKFVEYPGKFIHIFMKNRDPGA